MSLTEKQKTFLLGLSVSVILLATFFLGALSDRVFVVKPLDYLLGKKSISFNSPLVSNQEKVREISPLGRMLGEGGSVADIAAAASRSVVTVSIKKQQRVIDPFSNIFGFSPFGLQVPESQIEEIKQDIGTGFVVGEQGLVVTNRHVVADGQAEYTVIDKDDNEYTVSKIYRDPTVDMAILKVDGFNLAPLPLGDSDSLRVGEAVIAIGTALGEFRHTVTTGVISGLGRGIEATDGVSALETIEGVIQTDAAINPGNSGGPLIDSQGKVIGVNVATARADNISFAIPINVIKASIANFNETGQFDRSFLGIQYRMISEQAALFNEVPQGAYLVVVVPGSAAEQVGLQEGDILVEFDGQPLKGKDGDLAGMINQKKIGDKVKIKFWRNREEKSVEVVLRGNDS